MNRQERQMNIDRLAEIVMELLPKGPVHIEDVAEALKARIGFALPMEYLDQLFGDAVSLVEECGTSLVKLNGRYFSGCEAWGGVVPMACEEIPTSMRGGCISGNGRGGSLQGCVLASHSHGQQLISRSVGRKVAVANGYMRSARLERERALDAGVSPPLLDSAKRPALLEGGGDE